MEIEKAHGTILRCNNCLEEIEPERAVHVESDGYYDWIDIRVPDDSESGYEWIPVGRHNDIHFCSVECFVEYIQVKFRELER